MDLKAFAKAIIKMSFDDADLDLEEVHGLMVKHGLLIETTSDSGPWFEVAPELKD